jgi:hypothetical protein
VAEKLSPSMLRALHDIDRFGRYEIDTSPRTVLALRKRELFIFPSDANGFFALTRAGHDALYRAVTPEASRP